MPFLVYAIALVIAAGTLALSVNLATAPDIDATKPRVAANSPVRQIPLGKTPDVSRGDPHNQLTPIYPAAPGKDLPPPADVADNKPDDDATSNGDANRPVATAAAPATVAATAGASTTGSASSEDESEQPRVDVTAAAPNSCAVDVCSNAYRSFRASDCTYQPYNGPRKVCELSAGAVQNAGAAPLSQPRDVAPRGRVSDRVSDLDAAARVVRQLPGPDDFEDTRGRRVIVIERPGFRYEPGIVYEEW